MKRTTNKNFFFFIGASLLCSLMIIGGSYAILKRTVWSEKKTEVVAGTLSIKYEDGKTINLDNTYPMNDIRGMTTPSYQFSVENTGTIKTRYEITLEEESKSKDTLDSSYLRYSIKKNEEEWSNPQNLESLVLDSNIELNVDEKNEYQLKIWLDEKAGNETQGKEFKARIVVNAIQDNENLQDVTPPIIKLKGDLSVNVEENSEYEDLGVESINDDHDDLTNQKVQITYEYYNNEETTEEDHVDTSKVGVHYIYYRISDKSGNEGLIVRSVNVYHKDTNPPEINLNGESLIAVEKDSEYIDEGAEATDQEEENISDRVVTIGTVNTKKIGTYTIKYLITDQSGNTSSIVRVVNVVKTSSNVEDTITLDLTKKKTEQITITGENLGELSYQSKSDEIASVNESGLITANQVGTTTIIVTSTTGYKKEITVIVQKTVNITYDLNYNQNDMDTWKYIGKNLFESFYDEATKINDITINATPNIWENVYLPITTEIGKEYTVIFDYEIVKAYAPLRVDSGIGCQISNTVSSSDNISTSIAIQYLPTTQTGLTTTQINFKATQTTTYLNFNFGLAADNQIVNIKLGNFKITTKEEKVYQFSQTTIDSLPTFTREGYQNDGIWTNLVDGERVTVNTSVPSDDTTYYVKWSDTTKPEWSIFTITPNSGNILATDTITIVFNGTDTSNCVASSLTLDQVIVKLGTQTVNPTTKNLTLASFEYSKGKQYTLMLSGFGEQVGNLSIVIPANTLKDSSKNENIETVITTNINIGKMYKESILKGSDPVLGKNMIPVKIADSGEVRKVGLSEEWYKYQEQQWANAVILVDNPSKTYNINDSILEKDIESYFVWIPRYKYQLFDLGDYTGYVGTEKVTGNAKPIQIEFQNKNDPKEEGNEKGEYLTHPAFTLGKKELSGLWIGKFETGYNQTGDGSNPINTEGWNNGNAQKDEINKDKIIIKPNVNSWRNITVYKIFMNAFNYKRDLESHMMKNIEWGAVAYLSHSEYGINKEININNNNNYLTGYSATESTNQSNFPGQAGTSEEVTKKYNTETGYKASATGNISGIYDMNGGAHEYMAAYMEGYGVETSNGIKSGFSSEDLTTYTPYLDVYESNGNTTYKNRKLGDATGEMGPFYYYQDGDGNLRPHNAWYDDHIFFVTPQEPWFHRGGASGHGSSAGQFYCAIWAGTSSAMFGFRLVLAP